ncbi:hypothetical protein [Nonlabens sp. YIK11]|nr:hypothetical protein [Nonlabens sp. YIK11]
MNERLLIIDDDPIFCYILDKLIKKQGAYATATFNSALHRAGSPK